MKRIFILTLVAGITLNLAAQNLSGVSMGHYRAGKVLLENASSSDDYLSAAEEFEKVLAAEPNYAELYPELVNIYIKVGESKGSEYFDKAEELLQNYQRKFPDKVEEATYLSAMLKAAKSKWQKGPQRFCGKWVTKFLLPIELIISYSEGSYKVAAKPLVTATISDLTVNGNIITFKVKSTWTHDPYSIYDMDNDACDGYGRSGEFYVDYAVRTSNFKIVLEGNFPTQYTSYHVDYFYKNSKTWCCSVQMPETTLQRR